MTRKGILDSTAMSTDKNTRPKTAAADYRLIRKNQREAAKAGFTNPFIRKIQNADCNKTLYENRITTGNCIDGQIITLDAVRKWCGTGGYQQFREAVKNRIPFRSSRFDFRGYDGSLWVEPLTMKATVTTSQAILTPASPKNTEAV